MPVGPVITVIKAMPYRAETDEEWSNTYGFDGPVPPDGASWHGLLNELAAVEKTVYLSNCHIVGAYGYAGWPSKQNHAIWGIDLTQPPNTTIAGTLTPEASVQTMAGDQASWVNWKTDKRNSKGKPIYLRKYYHHGTFSGDAISITLKAALQALADQLGDGSWSPTGYGKLIGPNDAHPQTQGPGEWVTTRTLERRGKRPPLPSRGSSSVPAPLN